MTRTRTFYDSTSAGDLPAGGDGYLAYADGAYANVTAVRRRFPHAVVVPITVRGGAAHMADVEPGDLSPDSAARWARAQLDLTGTPETLYFPLSWHPQVLAACTAHRLRPGRDVLFFAARYGADRTIPPGFVGVQYASPDGPAGTRPPGHYDVSVVADYWPGVDRKPRVPRLGHGKRATARALTRELRRRKVPVPRKDRAVLLALLAQIRRLLGRTKP